MNSHPQVWAVAMVKDELDIICETITHLDGEGVSGIIVADNLSNDGTYGALKRLKTNCELILRRDTEPGYYQSHKMTRLAQNAFGMGADWVIPFDADELWYNTEGDLVDAFTGLEADCVLASLHNYFPTYNDNPKELNPFLRITHRDPQPAPLPKVAVRNRPDVVIAQGNHGATADGAFRIVSGTIEVAHFPWRSSEQYERKIRNGSRAYNNTDLPEDMGAHWRQHGQLLDREGSRALRTVFETHFVDPSLPLEHRPAPWAGTVS